MLNNTGARHWAFVVFAAVSLFVFYRPLYSLLTLSLGDYHYSHIAAVPLLSVCLVLVGRKRIFTECRGSLRAGVPVVLVGVAAYSITVTRLAQQAENLWAPVLAIVVVWAGGFLSVYGTSPFLAATFPLGLLAFLVPIPVQLLDHVNSVLQRGTADVTHLLLRLAGVPVFRDGFRFSLPGIDIEVAEECSGVRSAFALLITGLLAGYVFLRTSWGRVWLSAATIPIAIFKNGVRVAILSWLASYVDESYLHGKLHHSGGPIFSLLSMVLLVAALFALRKWELRPQRLE